MKNFSLILPTVNAYSELAFCIESLKSNSNLKNELIVIVDVGEKGNVNEIIINYLQSHKIRFYLNDKQLGPYGSWNKGAKIAKNKFLCFITDDQYFAPGWDVAIMKHMQKDMIISGQLVEPGVLLPSFKTVIRDFGETAKNFREKDFLIFAEKIKKEELTDGIFFIPLAIDRERFLNLGGFSVKGKFGTKSVPNDVLFIRQAKKNKMQFKSSLSSISYHFQASSWEKHKKIRKWKNKIKSYLKKFL